MKVVLLAGVILVVGFLIYVSIQEGEFSYERRGVIEASPEELYPYISDFEKGQLWSPYAKIDPDMKIDIKGPPGQPGSTMDFVGNSKAGSGHLEILRAIPNQLIELRLTMLKPFKAENNVQYRLTPVAEGTEFSWSMSGDGGFMGKLLNVFIDCEEMVAGQFSEGIRNLKTLIESKSNS